MNIKVAAFTVSEKSSNTTIQLDFPKSVHFIFAKLKELSLF